MLRKTLAAAVVAVLLANSAGAAVVSAFEENSEGWWYSGMPTGTGTCTIRRPRETTPTGSPSPGGGAAIGAADRPQPVEVDVDIWGFTAPAKFRGDQSAAFGKVLSYDLFVSACDSSWRRGKADVVLTGNNLILDWYSNTPPAASAWKSYEVTLASTDAAGAWYVRGGSSTPNATQWATVLSDLTGLYIRGEYKTGADWAWLDSVKFGAPIPEPSTFALLGFGALGLLAYAWRRRKHT